MKIILLRSAVEDMIRGRAFYDKQEEGLGDYFEDTLSSDINSLRLYAGIHAKSHGYHRMLSSKFPFAVYYDVVAEQIRIWAILDCRRDPKWIRSRLRHPS